MFAVLENTFVGELKVHGSRHKRKHPRGRRKKGRKKRRMMRKRRDLRT